VGRGFLVPPEGNAKTLVKRGGGTRKKNSWGAVVHQKATKSKSNKNKVQRHFNRNARQEKKKNRGKKAEQ